MRNNTMNDRQEQRGFADLRHRDRKKRLQQLLASKAKKPATESLKPDATVLASARGLCTIVDAEGERTVRCDLPVAPGDEVAVRHEKVAAVGPRRTTLARTDPGNPHRELVIAANIDLLIIVAPMVDPPFRPGLVDRYLIAAARGGIQAVLCLNKIDLCADTSPAEIFPVPRVRCSAVTGQGIDELLGLLAGNLAVLAGHSGVGKSSLLNALTGGAPERTGRVNDETGKGRHTTTSSRLYALDNGGRIIDTPGVREYGLGAVHRADLQAAFPEFTAEGCRFRDCLHRDEPGCAVREAGGPRYQVWLRLTGLT
jgi:ribosome biogenesis GTPase